MTKPYELGPVDLTVAEHKLTAVVAGANPQAKPRHILSLDYVRLVPVP